ncbi:Na(+)-translocating NADH-quinone reductase subunit C [Maioricimonas rarisocia]|uniref:Na(+)-translocating NADH-quinone reductase subunit C n=1 Tax=Maioricimonas rarisocia TaxID=2528026 RepID=A0A517Z6C7_9PLAN|nr:Na(+)-translocating NADH-quinone reductase subunit C [Maioricimonas rarisocia]QDU38048.1 Na(+)-translocating NADH-quinone reductase subunit C [Maioricimonas rarisocia]
MSFRPNSLSGTLTVATVLCVVCSLIVSGVTVGLRPLQVKNEELKKKRNVLAAAGLWNPEEHSNEDVPELFEQIETVLINLPASTEDAPEPGTLNESLDPTTYNPLKAAKDPTQNVTIAPDQDIAGIKTRERVATAYLVKKDGQIDQIVLPVYGKGLWSTLYGFVSVAADGRTVRGITFYQHAETPGLGGEVDNPRWKAQWNGKVAIDEEGQPQIDVVKGSADGENQIDGLSGATITSVGVENLVNYWLGDDAFGPFLERLRSGELQVAAR